VVVSKQPKTKRDNAFSICSAPPSSSILIRELQSQHRQIASAKIQNSLEIKGLLAKILKINMELFGR